MPLQEYHIWTPQMALMLLPPQKFTRSHDIGIFVVKDCVGGMTDATGY